MIEMGGKTLVIGERINPTGREKLAEALRRGNLEIVAEEAGRQAAAGADVIDVNVGTPGVDEAELLPRAVAAVYEATGLPVCADSSEPDALVASLGAAPEMILNSTTADDEYMDKVIPAAAGGDAMIVGITKDHTGIPGTVDERLEMAARIADRVSAAGIPRERLLIDFLTIPVSAEGDAAIVTLECIRRGTAELGVGTVLGASNVSYGMPARDVVNSAFLSMCVLAGLRAAIVNPLEPRVVQSILAADVLVGRDRLARAFLKDFRRRRSGGGSSG